MILNSKGILVALLLIPGLGGPAFAHTIDSVGEYRIEIGWMNEPVVSNETNAIELFVSKLEPGLKLEEQEFKDGITGLEETIKLELVYRSDKITLPFSSDHNIEGKYFAYVTPTVSGFYQANILGTIVDTPISLSMHPPKVDERSYIEFPEPADITITQIIDGHTTLIENINDLKDSTARIEQTAQQYVVGYVGAGLGVLGLAIAAVALARSKR